MIPWLSADDAFPPLECALGDETGAGGLLAASAGVSAKRLVTAYRSGIFPWYSEGQPVLWWSTDPRMILEPQAFKVSASLRKTLRAALRDARWEIRVDFDFETVMRACAGVPRAGQDGTWITEAMIAAYVALHRRALAHSVEAWYDDQLVGGLYCVAIGRMVFGESMFARRTDASKIALAALCGELRRAEVVMIDCQQSTGHLASLGGRSIARELFLSHVRHTVDEAPLPWRFDKSALLEVAGLPSRDV
ncbi:MAG: leucyl/phenylalanyl-tRNA--protein transferase [Janthinobacterium lividum]